MTDDIHSCSYYCTRPACVLAQRNEMRDAAPPDHLAVMRQALEALEERYVGALRDKAMDALRAALGEKRC
jgi:hypothetical protein